MGIFRCAHICGRLTFIVYRQLIEIRRQKTGSRGKGKVSLHPAKVAAALSGPSGGCCCPDAGITDVVTDRPAVRRPARGSRPTPVRPRGVGAAESGVRKRGAHNRSPQHISITRPRFLPLKRPQPSRSIAAASPSGFGRPNRVWVGRSLSIFGFGLVVRRRRCDPRMKVNN